MHGRGIFESIGGEKIEGVWNNNMLEESRGKE